MNIQFNGAYDLNVCLCSLNCSVVSNSLQALDCSPQGSSVRGIFLAKILEWAAISSSRGSGLRFPPPGEVGCDSLLQGKWAAIPSSRGSGLRFPPPGDLPNPGMETMSLVPPALAGKVLTTAA